MTYFTPPSNLIPKVKPVRKSHTATREDAGKILQHVQFNSDDPSRVEMPTAELLQMFDITFPLNLLKADRSQTLVNGFSRETQPHIASFNIATLANEAGVEVEEAERIVRNNNVHFTVTKAPPSNGAVR